MSRAEMNTASETHSAPKGWVPIAALVLVLAAGAGTYLGVMRSLGAHDLPSDADPLSSVPNVTTAKPLADTTADDAHIRAIAREEALAALKSAAPAKPKPVVAKSDDDATSASDATAALNAAAAGRAAGASAPSPTVRPATRPPASANPYPPAAASPN